MASQAEKAKSHCARLMGLMGRRTLPEGAALLNAIQDVYLCEDVTIA